MNGKTVRLIRKFVKGAKESQLRKLGLSMDDIIENPYRQVKKRYSLLVHSDRQEYKDLLRSMIP